MIPELVGRLPVVSTLDTLNEDDLMKVLLEPKNSLVKQYEKLFMLEGIELEFRQSALRAIVSLAIKHKSGGYLPAFSKDSDKNERLMTKIETSIGTMKLIQIAGVLVRRIVSYVKPNAEVSKGERIGLIHFGSRVDLSFESAGINLLVKKGDRVLAGQQVAEYTPMSSLSVTEKLFEVPKRMLSKLQATQSED